jgi:hypothetical protein
MVIVLFVAALLVLGLVVRWWGADSRDGHDWSTPHSAARIPVAATATAAGDQVVPFAENHCRAAPDRIIEYALAAGGESGQEPTEEVSSPR